MEDVYNKKTKTNTRVLALTQACTYMVRTTKEKGCKIEGTRSQVHFGYFPAWRALPPPPPGGSGGRPRQGA